MTAISIATTDILMDVIAQKSRPRLRTSTNESVLADRAIEPGVNREFEQAIAVRKQAADSEKAPLPPTATNQFNDLTVREAKMRASFQRLESIIIKQFIETALPKSSSSFLSDNVGHGIWREKLAHVISDEVAKQGSLGIAERLIDSWRNRA